MRFNRNYTNSHSDNEHNRGGLIVVANGQVFQFGVKDQLQDAREMIFRYERLEEQVRAALDVFENDGTFNSTALVMADKLYDGLNALDGRGAA